MTDTEGLAEADRVRALRDAIEEVVTRHAPDAAFFGRNAARLCNTSCFALPGLKAETAQIAFDLAGIALSSGSACSSGRIGPSHVLEAMGRGEDASALRVSIGPGNSDADVAAFEAALGTIIGRLRSKPRAA